MTENKLLSSCLMLLRAELADLLSVRPGPVILKHSDGNTSGVPDVSITVRHRTSWWEFKHGKTVVWMNALQQLTCRRLAANGICYVVLYEDVDGMRRTVILTPDEVEVEAVYGFDHKFVMDYIRRIHAT